MEKVLAACKGFVQAYIDDVLVYLFGFLGGAY